MWIKKEVFVQEVKDWPEDEKPTHKFVNIMWVAARYDTINGNEMIFWTGSRETKDINLATQASMPGYLDYAGGHPPHFRKWRMVTIEGQRYLLKE